MKLRLWLSVLLLVVSLGVFGQRFAIQNPYFNVNSNKVLSYDSISLISVLEKLLFVNPDSAVLIRATRLTIEIPQEDFMFEDSVVYKHILGKHPDVKLNEVGQIILQNHLFLRVDSIDIMPLIIQGFEFSRGIDLTVKRKALGLSFQSCQFYDVTKFQVNNGIFFEGNTFDQGIYIRNQEGTISIEENEIHTPPIEKIIEHFPYRSYPYVINIHSSELEYLSFFKNKIVGSGLNAGISRFSVPKIGRLSFSENNFDGIVDMSGILVERRVSLKDNTFNGQVCLYNFVFPDNFNKIYWKQFDGQKLVTSGKEVNTEFRGMLDFIYTSNTDSLVEEYHKDLIVTYKTLHRIFSENGDTESANGCYAENKDLEGIWLKHVYKTNGGFKAYINYQLNRLLKFYTNHGTDPALAILMSIYVLLSFTVFYFFFPSEWDIYSKSRLIKNFKDFREKNDKGYLKPFLYMLAGFLLSFINALTLSINSFVTLGFGNIPTKGLARYVCIIQGFIGWFLLSIFTVALINQVLS